ncbi:MAG TPA: pyridoxal-phosphate dependent enzyme [Jiangellaceae bacterium]|nr:pyridoxal-phosphate dependent enzyme [Jiangellaceae bacterium]
MPVDIDGVRVLVKEEASDRSGSHKQRAADAMVAAALVDGFARVIVGSCGNYGIAVAAAGRAHGAAVTVVLPADAGDAIDRVRALGAEPVVIEDSYEAAVGASRALAARSGAADGNVDGPYEPCIDRALGAIAFDVLAVVGARLGALDGGPGAAGELVRAARPSGHGRPSRRLGHRRGSER